MFEFLGWNTLKPQIFGGTHSTTLYILVYYKAGITLQQFNQKDYAVSPSIALCKNKRIKVPVITVDNNSNESSKKVMEHMLIILWKYKRILSTYTVLMKASVVDIAHTAMIHILVTCA